jgi:hypothetical protein
MNKPFEALADTWVPRVQHFFQKIGDEFSDRLKSRFSDLLMDSAFSMAALFFIAGLIAWLSGAAWLALTESGISGANASLYVAGGFAASAAIIYGLGRWRNVLNSAVSESVLEIESDHPTTFLQDLGAATRQTLDPNEVLKPHAVKVVLASTAIGFFIAFNPISRKEI